MRPTIHKTTILAGLALLAATAPAMAHPPGALGAGFAAGFAHPIHGLDHLLAMVAVGLWAAQLGGRAVWILPVAFVAVMAVGGVVGVVGPAFAPVELLIAGSVAILGAAVALGARVSTFVAASLVGVFAFFHGHAHGAEILPGTSALSFGVGFVVATVMLHAGGLVAALALAKVKMAPVTCAGGGAIAAVGAVMLIV